ncbi:squalene synthase HpnC [Ideonella livida]|uniref:Squalene synthase HpnC n=1 Tax=Ideonella livida TaxID=2707176 RepID=A0A7C9PGA8_9BURK|nr:squalene synthase HpnC [Ideonella livida]NDY90732.1 squalene synthase HpnC [Ideonella livida]
MSVNHYENFPVASLLCPPVLRPAVVAIYRFARTADDLADEGEVALFDRLEALDSLRDGVTALWADNTVAERWADILAPLLRVRQRHALPLQPFLDLLSAFRQDCANPVHPDMASVLDYCARSANPVGRLMLHLYGVHDPASQAQSDAICTALQLINFWQDLGQDLTRGRLYLPRDLLLQQHLARDHDLTADALCRHLQCLAAHPEGRQTLRAVVAARCQEARTLMLSGADLPLRLPGRIGWELRLVVQGGLRILDHIQAMDHNTALSRPRLGPADLPLLIWRAARQRPQDRQP